MKNSPSRPLANQHIAGLDSQPFKRSLAHLKAFSQMLVSKSSQETDEELPLWEQNRKLLVRVFVVWLMLLGYMLISVFSHSNM